MNILWKPLFFLIQLSYIGHASDFNERYYAQYENGVTPLHQACREGDVSRAAQLLDQGVNIEAIDSNNSTPLCDHILWFSPSEHLREIVRLLLDHGACKTKRDRFGWTALDKACEKGNVPCVDMLLENCISITENPEFSTALFWACKGGNDHIVESLLDLGALKNKPLSIGGSFWTYTPMHIACAEGHSSIVKLLLARKGRNQIKNCRGERPFDLACKNGHFDVVQLLLKQSMRPKSLNKSLFLACKNNHLQVAILLIKNGASIEEKDSRNNTPLSYCDEEMKMELVREYRIAISS